MGSVPLPDAESVFRAGAEHLGDRLRRVPDGETGPRLDWIVWQLHRFMADPQFEVIPPGPRNYAPNPRVALREGVSTDDFDFGALGYAESAVSSCELFSDLQASRRPSLALAVPSQPPDSVRADQRVRRAGTRADAGGRVRDGDAA